MATTAFGTNDAPTVKRWARYVEREALPYTLVDKISGGGMNSCIKVQDELSKNEGDRVRFHLLSLLTGDGLQSDGVGEGNEEEMSYTEDDLLIEEIRHQVRFKRKLHEQRTVFQLRNDAKDLLAQWHAERMDVSFINQMTGNTLATGGTKFTGNNAVAAYDPDHVYIHNQATTDALTSSDVFDLDVVEKLAVMAETMRNSNLPVIRPAKIPFAPDADFLAVISPLQAYDARRNATAGEWLDLQKSVMAGGVTSESKNLVFRGGKYLGTHAGVAIVKSTRIPQAINNAGSAYVANTATGFFVGACGACLGFGRETKGMNKFSWSEETFDYKHEHGIDAALICGLKRTAFDADNDGTKETYGAIAFSTYATPV